MMTNKWFSFIREGLAAKNITEVLNLLEGYGDNTWIFIDTESTGMDPKVDQLLQIGAIAVDPRKWFENAEIIDTFNVKVKLSAETKQYMNNPSPEQQKSWEKQQKRSNKPLKGPKDSLSMTKYGDKKGSYLEEQDALEKFEEFISGFKSPILVAHNAKHDMSFLNGRKITRLPKIPVFDTYPLITAYLIPALLKIEKATIEPEETDVKNMAADILKKISNDKGQHSSSLGKVALAMGFSVENWHTAVNDIRLLMDVFKKTVDILVFAEEHKIDIRPEHDYALSRMNKRKKS